VSRKPFETEKFQPDYTANGERVKTAVPHKPVSKP